MSTFGVVFLPALALTSVIRLWLGWRQLQYIGAHRGAVPPQFTAEINLAAHQKAADYTCARTRLAMVDLVTSAVILLALTFGGGLQWLHDLSAHWLAEGIARGVALIALLGLLTTALDLPFDLYRTFVVEQRFGFNKTTLGLFLADLAKGLALGAVLVLPLVALILWLVQALGAWWWIYAWAVVVVYGVFV